MISLRGFLILLRIPVRQILVILKACVGRSPYRKFKRLPVNLARVLAYNGFLLVPVKDCTHVCFMLNPVMFNLFVKPANHKLVSKCGCFGKRYDENLIWLLKQLDHKQGDPCLIYLHGGGYYFDVGPSQIELTLAIWDLVNAALKNMLVLFLDYKLACDGYTVPTQLQQLHQTYMRLCQEDGWDTIYLMGDSAGGNLALAYVQYLRNNQSDPKIAELPFPKKVVLILPWVKLHPEPYQFVPGSSWYDNNGHDIIDYEVFADLDRVHEIIGDEPLDLPMVSPGNCTYSTKDWEDIPSLADLGYDVIVIVGEDEVFRDDILEWCKYALGCPLYDEHRYGDSGGHFDPEKHQWVRDGVEGCSHVEVYVEPYGLHDQLNFFENHLLHKLGRKQVLPQDLDGSEFFGIKRVAQLLSR